MYFTHRTESDSSRVRRDLQSKAPVFEKVLYTATVSEEEPAGVSVCTVSARDQAGGSLSYAMVSLLDARSQGMFTIDAKSGIVSTLTSLDRSGSVKTFSFKLHFVDSSTRSQNILFYFHCNSNRTTAMCPLRIFVYVELETIKQFYVG